MVEETRNAPYSNMEDRISRLPDSLIHHILSFIDAQYAVQTSVLSKRWIDIWKSLPFLNFDRWSFDKKKKFIMFVDMVFIFRKDFDIQRFSLVWKDAYKKTVTMDVNRWSLNAVKYNVQEISIRITECHDSDYEIPHGLLNCKSLRKLFMELRPEFDEARYVDIILPSSMNLPQLKALHLHGLSILNAESSKRLFSSCPVLETLYMSCCDIQTDNWNLVVDSVSLKYFVYTTLFLPQNDNTAIKLCAPNLEEFTCTSVLTQDFSLENCSPVSKVYFDMRLNNKDENAETYSNLPSKEKKVYAKRMMQFLGAVYMVKSMKLSSGFLEVLSQAPDLLDCQPPRLCNLHEVVLEMWSTRSCLRAIAYLLSISPNITRVFLDSKESNFSDVGDDWEAGLSPPGMLSHLDFVQIDEVEGCLAELKLLSFLLINAKNLRGVALFFRPSVGSPSRVRQVEQFLYNLRAVPPASSSINWRLTCNQK